MNKHVRPPTERYYAEAASWAQDRNDELRNSRRIAWIVAICLGVIALCEALALLFLTPLKTVVPYTLLVDRQTGFVQVLKPLDPATTTADAALTQSFLVQYVIARESYDVTTIDQEYRKVALWSSGLARSQYLARMPAGSPDSPLTLYPRSTIVSTQVKSVSPLGQNRALVRFETRRQDQGGQPRVIGAWAAVVDYRYSTQPLSIEDRYVNPLGFQVVRYRRDPEALPPEPAPTATPQALPGQPVLIAPPAAAPTPAPENPNARNAKPGVIVTL